MTPLFSGVRTAVADVLDLAEQAAVAVGVIGVLALHHALPVSRPDRAATAPMILAVTEVSRPSGWLTRPGPRI